jgi:hypothetical protein
MRYSKELQFYTVGSVWIKQHEPARIAVFNTVSGKLAFFAEFPGARKCAERWDRQNRM